MYFYVRDDTLRMNAVQREGVGKMRSVLVTMTSFCVQRGEGVKKGQKIAVILKVCPLSGKVCVQL